MKPEHVMIITFVATFVLGMGLMLKVANRDNRIRDPMLIKAIYNNWKNEYNVKVGAAEDDLRLKIFTHNFDYIQTHNAMKSSYKLGLNQFAHLTVTEFSALHLGYSTSAAKKSVASAPVNATCVEATNFTVPDSIDWEASGKVSRVKDQGHCGSCWAFSAVGAIESLLAITTGQVTELSEQQLVDCSTPYGNNGCNGGDMFLGFKYVADHGIVVESSYPYTAADGTCNVPANVPTFHISGYRNVTANSSAALQAAVAKNPVSVAIEADTSEFQLYKSGVLTGDGCGTTLDHGVLAVGYGTQDGTPFWKVKNSWGPNWGANGYILIERRDGPGTCGINMDNSYPTHYC